MQILGVDIGGSGIKGAVVDTVTGKLVTERYRLATPQPATPDSVTEVMAALVKHFEWKDRIGCGFPCVIRQGVSYSAANIDESWIGVNIENLFSRGTGCKTYVINDADAAGLAEMRFGAGKDAQKGVVLILTIGTGIGSAIFTDGHLLPNTEFGHLEMDGKDAERRASDAARHRKKLSWSEWGSRLNQYLELIDRLIFPDLIILGGGVSKDFETFRPYLTVQTKVVPAELLNLAGMIGAGIAAELKEV